WAGGRGAFGFGAGLGSARWGGGRVVGFRAPPASAEAKSDSKPVPSKAEQKPAVPAAEARPGAPKEPPAGMQTVTIIDGASGSRQEVTVPAQGTQQVAAPDPKLLEATRHGQSPRVSHDGMRPLAAYARKVDEARIKSNMPRIAVVVGGLGIGASTTGEAIAKLPPSISLAFAPYGTDLERVASRARGEGHEVL